MRDALLRQCLYLLDPIGFVWFCLLVLTAALWRKRLRRFACATAIIALFVTVVGSTSVPEKLLASLERPYAGGNPDALPPADAIVLLGGCATSSRYEISNAHLASAGDRIVMAHALFKMGKAPVLVLGGNVSKLDGVNRLEGEIVRDLLARRGLSRDASLPLAANADTHDEALKVRALAAERGWRRILLITSANHMRRASATFRAQGLEVIAAPCDFQTTVSTAGTRRGLSVPHYDGFIKASTWLHEKVGWEVYRWRGWLAPEANAGL